MFISATDFIYDASPTEMAAPTREIYHKEATMAAPTREIYEEASIAIKEPVMELSYASIPRDIDQPIMEITMAAPTREIYYKEATMAAPTRDVYHKEATMASPIREFNEEASIKIDNPAIEMSYTSIAGDVIDPIVDFTMAAPSRQMYEPIEEVVYAAPTRTLYVERMAAPSRELPVHAFKMAAPTREMYEPVREICDNTTSRRMSNSISGSDDDIPFLVAHEDIPNNGKLIFILSWICKCLK